MKIDVESSTIDCLESLAESQSEGMTGQLGAEGLGWLRGSLVIRT